MPHRLIFILGLFAGAFGAVMLAIVGAELPAHGQLGRALLSALVAVFCGGVALAVISWPRRRHRNARIRARLPDPRPLYVRMLLADEAPPLAPGLRAVNDARASVHGRRG